VSTPSYGLKHWWRAARRPGESLKQFARRFVGRGATYTTASRWFDRKKGREIKEARP